MKMNKTQIQNTNILLREMACSRIMSRSIQIGILCVMMKESGMIPRVEHSYEHTSNKRIRKIFGKKKLGEFYDSDEDLNRLKKDPVHFFNKVYGGILGNKYPMDGWRFRGKGLGQITGREMHARYSYHGHNLIWNPMDLLIPDVAAHVTAAHFEQVIFNNEKLLTDRYDVDVHMVYGYVDIGVQIAANINAGLGNGKNSAVVTRATRNAMVYAEEMEKKYDEYWEKEMNELLGVDKIIAGMHYSVDLDHSTSDK